MSAQDRFSGPRWRIGAVVAGMVAGLAYVAQIVVGMQLATWIKITLTVAGAILLAFSIALPTWQAGMADRARKAALQTANEAVADYDIKVHKILFPAIALAAKIISERDDDKRRRLEEKLKQFVVDSARQNIDGTDPRSCLYTYGKAGSMRRLTLEDGWGGRQTQPRAVFTLGDDAGNEAFRVLDEREAKFVRNTDEDPPPGWKKDKDYKTYIQVAVASGETPFGLLCVDAVHPGDLTDIDKRLVQLLAQLLGCGLGSGKCKPVNDQAG